MVAPCAIWKSRQSCLFPASPRDPCYRPGMSRTKVSPLAVLLWFTRAAVRHPWRVLAGAALLTAGATALSARLEIRSSFEELLPKSLPSVAQIRELSRRVGGDGNVLVNVESLEGPAGLARAQRLAPVLAAISSPWEPTGDAPSRSTWARSSAGPPSTGRCSGPSTSWRRPAKGCERRSASEPPPRIRW